MENLVDFLLHYYREIILGIITIIELIILIVKRNKTEIYDASAYSKLLTLILEAEEKFGSGHGSEKLNYVVDQYFALTGIKDDAWNRSSIYILVERILSAPQKKGERDEKVK